MAWRDIWEKREGDSGILDAGSKEEILMELKRAAGFDIGGEGLSADALMEQYRMMKKNLSCGPRSSRDITSVYEVGCGSGANLFLFEQDGIECGGIDYSEALLGIARRVLSTRDLICGEAADMPENSGGGTMLFCVTVCSTISRTRSMQDGCWRE